MNEQAATHRRILDPFHVMRTTRVLAPHDAKLNDIRWLIGESLRRLDQRARLDHLRGAVDNRCGLPASEAALYAKDKLRRCEDRAGPAAWPIVRRVVIEGASVRDCRQFAPEVVTSWRADAVITDRLRVALDLIGSIVGVTTSGKDTS